MAREGMSCGGGVSDFQRHLARMFEGVARCTRRSTWPEVEVSDGRAFVGICRQLGVFPGGGRFSPVFGFGALSAAGKFAENRLPANVVELTTCCPMACASHRYSQNALADPTARSVRESDFRLSRAGTWSSKRRWNPGERHRIIPLSVSFHLTARVIHCQSMPNRSFSVGLKLCGASNGC